MSQPLSSNLEQTSARYLPVVLGIVASIVIGFYLPANPGLLSAGLVGVLVMVVWIVALPEYWWTAVPIGLAVGGGFELNFKLYPREIALITSLVPLVISLAIRRRGLSQGRPALPKVCYFLAGYLILHCFGSMYYNRYFEGVGGFGNVLRAYLNALLGILFICLFNQWGSSSAMRPVLALFYWATWFRVIYGLASFFVGYDLVIPVINYGISSDDLRVSALTLGAITVGYFCLSSGFVMKTLHVMVFTFSGAAVLSGGSRTGLVIYMSIPFWLALIYKRYVALAAIGTAAAISVLTVNVAPSLLESVSPQIARALSVSIIDRDVAEQYGRASSSDYWHRRLAEHAFKRWTESYGHIAFGTGIRRFESDAVNTDESRNLLDRMEVTLEAAASVGSYESGFWTVLAVTGAVGLFFYGSVLVIGFIPCLKSLMTNGIRTPAHVFAFLGCVLTGGWVGLFWTYGGYPSLEIMYLFLAKISFEDYARRNTGDQKVNPAENTIANSEYASLFGQMRAPEAHTISGGRDGNFRAGKSRR